MGVEPLGAAPAVPLAEVEWRVQGKVDNGGGVTVVPYLDAPTVARLLDEWVGPANWRDEYDPSDSGKVMWCRLSVRDPVTGEWVTKVDVGTPSSFEAAKGLVTDAFKRVAMRKWQVGGNVFALPNLRLGQGKFRTWTTSKGETQAALTDDSAREIARLLKAQGFEDAADVVRVGDDDDDVQAARADTPSPPEPGPGGDAPPTPPSPPGPTTNAWDELLAAAPEKVAEQARQIARDRWAGKTFDALDADRQQQYVDWLRQLIGEAA